MPPKNSKDKKKKAKSKGKSQQETKHQPLFKDSYIVPRTNPHPNSKQYEIAEYLPWDINDPRWKQVYAFQNRLLTFKERYKDQLSKDDVIDEGCFLPIAREWKELRRKYPKGERYARINDEDFQPFLDACKEVYGYFANLAYKRDLCGTYQENNGQVTKEYTYVAGEILELGALSLRAYTEVLTLCDNEWEYEWTKTLASKLVHAFYDDKVLPVMGVPHQTAEMLNSPTHAALVTSTMVPREFVNVVHLPKRKPYAEIVKEREEREKRRDQEVKNPPEQQKKNDEKEKIEAERIKQEKQQQLEREELVRKVDEELQEIDSYESTKTSIPRVPNQEQPDKINAMFYRYFEKFADEMGIDEKDLNAQSLINAMTTAHLKNEGSDTKAFRTEVQKYYRHLRRQTYESYLKKCVENNSSIDFNKASKEVDRLMGVLLYTVDPVGFQEKNPETASRAQMLFTGNVGESEHRIIAIDRKDVLGHAKYFFANKSISTFTKDAEARFQSYTDEKRSTNQIVKKAKNLLSAYLDSKNLSKDSAEESLKNEYPGQLRLYRVQAKKAALDEAYALEKRIETRYASRAARFFRYFSYQKQLDMLDRMKKGLGLNPNERVATNYFDARMEGSFADDSDPKLYDEMDKDIKPEEALDRIVSDLKERAGDLPEISKEEMQEKHEQFLEDHPDLAMEINTIKQSHVPEEIRPEPVSPVKQQEIPEESEQEEPENDEPVKEEVVKKEDVEIGLENIKKEEKPVEKFPNGFRLVPVVGENNQMTYVKKSLDEEEVFSHDSGNTDQLDKLAESKQQTGYYYSPRERLERKLYMIREKFFNQQVEKIQDQISTNQKMLRILTRKRLGEADELQETLNTQKKDRDVLLSEKRDLQDRLETLSQKRDEYSSAIVMLQTEVLAQYAKEEKSSADVNGVEINNFIKGNEKIVELESNIELINSESLTLENVVKEYENKIQTKDKRIKSLEESISKKRDTRTDDEAHYANAIKKLEKELEMKNRLKDEMLRTGRNLPYINVENYDENLEYIPDSNVSDNQEKEHVVIKEFEKIKEDLSPKIELKKEEHVKSLQKE